MPASVIIGRPAQYARSLRHAALVRSLLAVVAIVVGAVAVVAGIMHGFNLALLLPGLCLAAGGYFFYVKAYSSIKRTSAGIRAEDRVARVLNQAGAYHVAHGALLGAGGDADHIILGPSAVVVETKHGRGNVRYEQGHVIAGVRRIPKDPVGQVRRQAAALSRLTACHVTAIICIPDMTNSPIIIGSHHNQVTICSLADLAHLVKISSVHLSPEQSEKIVSHLKF